MKKNDFILFAKILGPVLFILWLIFGFVKGFIASTVAIVLDAIFALALVAWVDYCVDHEDNI